MIVSWKNYVIAAVLCAALAAGFIWWERPMDEFGTRVCNRSFSEDKIVALTFDDGPHPVTTPLLLNTLKKCNVKATFFTVGEKAAEYPELLRRINAKGHQVACHTYSHHRFTSLTTHEAENEITYWENNVDRIIGHGSRYVRPPGGEYDKDTISILKKRGYILSLWSLNPGDWHMPPPRYIVKYVMGKIRPGDIVLMHDDGLNTVHALPVIIKDLRAKGYRFATMEELQCAPPSGRSYTVDLQPYVHILSRLTGGRSNERMVPAGYSAK